MFCKSEPKLSTYNGLIDHIREKITNKSVLIVPGVTLDPNLTSEIEILIVASGIDSTTAESTTLESACNAQEDYLDDDLTFVDDKEKVYTDIPAITRKLRAIRSFGASNA